MAIPKIPTRIIACLGNPGREHERDRAGKARPFFPYHRLAMVLPSGAEDRSRTSAGRSAYLLVRTRTKSMRPV